MKAIETRYRGYRFRSRLEARWAVFFQNMGWRWRYEHQGYEIGWDEPRLAWLPDFEVEIPMAGGDCQTAYVEVKGDRRFFTDTSFCDALDFGGGPPGFDDCHNEVVKVTPAFCKHGTAKPILVLGDVPAESQGFLFLPFLTHREGVHLVWTALSNPRGGFAALKDSAMLWCAFQDTEQENTNVQSDGVADFQPKIITTKRAVLQPLRALAAARTARFEHGEQPA